MRHVCLVACAMAALTLTAAIHAELVTEVPAENGVNPWTHLDFNDSSDEFQFVIVGDRTGGARPGIFESAVEKINLMQPEFVISVGDFIRGYTQDSSEVDEDWDMFEAIASDFEMPFFYGSSGMRVELGS